MVSPPPPSVSPPANVLVALPVFEICPVTPRLEVVAVVKMPVVMLPKVEKSVVAVSAVLDANGSRDATSVEVAIKYDAVGVLVGVYLVPSKDTMPSPDAPEFVPPFATGRIPVISLAPPARLMADEEMSPATEWRTPVPRAPKLMVPLAWRAEVEAEVELSVWIVDDASAISPPGMETTPFVPTASDDVPETAEPFAL